MISGVHWAGHGFPGHPIVLGVHICSAGGRLAHQSCCGDLYSGNECPILPPSGEAQGAEFCVPLDLVGRGGLGCKNASVPATRSSHIVHVASCLHRVRREKGKAGSQSQRLGPGSGREMARTGRERALTSGSRKCSHSSLVLSPGMCAPMTPVEALATLQQWRGALWLYEGSRLAIPAPAASSRRH